jgi:hypothetical protein
MPAPRDIVKKNDKEPQRERRRLMGIDIKVEKIIMSAEIAEGSTVEVKVYLDDEQGELREGGWGGFREKANHNPRSLFLQLSQAQPRNL